MSEPLRLPPEVFGLLKMRAAEAGMSPGDYVELLVLRDLVGEAWKLPLECRAVLEQERERLRARYGLE